MPGLKRPAARIAAHQQARVARARAGADVQASRRRRRWTQQQLGQRVGISRSYVARIESGQADGVPLEVWFAMGEALGRPFRAEFVRDRLDEPADAGHLAIQELVLRLGRAAGYDGRFELATRPANPAHSADAVLVDRRRRQLIIVECWNTFGDLGAAARSSNRKLAEAQAVATSLGGDDGHFSVGLCWVVRDTARNRQLIERYPHTFAARLPGPSLAWASALSRGAPMPVEAGLVWCDAGATRIFARRRRTSATAR